jgi:aminopeptidase N
MEPDRLSQQMLRATVRGFWQTEQLDLCEPFVDPYLAMLPDIWRTRTWGVADTITVGLYPSRLVQLETLRRTDRALDGGMDDRLRRLLIEQRSDLARALAARAIDIG